MAYNYVNICKNIFHGAYNAAPIVFLLWLAYCGMDNYLHEGRCDAIGRRYSEQELIELSIKHHTRKTDDEIKRFMAQNPECCSVQEYPQSAGVWQIKVARIFGIYHPKVTVTYPHSFNVVYQQTIDSSSACAQIGESRGLRKE